MLDNGSAQTEHMRKSPHWTGMLVAFQRSSTHAVTCMHARRSCSVACHIRLQHSNHKKQMYLLRTATQFACQLHCSDAGAPPQLPTVYAGLTSTNNTVCDASATQPIQHQRHCPLLHLLTVQAQHQACPCTSISPIGSSGGQSHA